MYEQDVRKQHTYDTCCDGAYDDVRRRVLTVFIVPFFHFLSVWAGMCGKYWTMWFFLFVFSFLFYEMISIWMFVSLLIRCNIYRRTNSVLHTCITTLRNINKILRELVSLLPVWLLLKFSMFYSQAFTKHRQMSRSSAERHVKDTRFFFFLNKNTGMVCLLTDVVISLHMLIMDMNVIQYWAFNYYFLTVLFLGKSDLYNMHL